MQQITPFFYLVSTGEIVTIEVTPLGVAPETVLGAERGITLQNQTPGTNVVTFVFPVTLPANSNHIASVLCNFPETPGDPPGGGNPRCTFQLRGSAGGGVFPGLDINKSAPVHTAEFVFHIPESIPAFAEMAVNALQPHLDAPAGAAKRGAAKKPVKKRR